MSSDTPTPGTLRREIAEYIRAAGGIEMPDLRASAEACERRIEAMGYRWDFNRMLWRAPERKLRTSRNSS